jgi:hypothetical protein
MRSATLALATLFFFGCQTVQVRAGPGLPPAPAAPPPRVALAEPELDLWLEGNEQVTSQETAEGLRAARAALGAALDRQGFVPTGEADEVLVVRAQGVARTAGRRSAQVGAVVGIVLVVAAIVVLIATSGHGDRGGARAHPAGRGRAIPAHPGYGRPAYGYGPPAPWFGIGFAWGLHVPMGEPPPYPPAIVPTLESRLSSRGFFAGDETEIALELRDARTGEVVWSRAARQEIDPRDAGAVRALVDQMLQPEPWAQALLAPGAPPSGPTAPRAVPPPPRAAPPPPPAVPPPPPPAPPAAPPAAPQNPAPPKVETALR